MVVLGTSDGDLKHELLCPSRFLGESPEKQSKWPPLLPTLGLHEFFICGTILTNKRSILTNSGVELFMTFILTLNVFLNKHLRLRPQPTHFRSKFNMVIQWDYRD